MDNMQKIPVFFTFDANYLLAAKVAMHSMMKHALRQYWYELYVFHTTLSPKAQQSLRNSIKEFGHTELHFIDVTQYDEKIRKFGTKAHYTKEIFTKAIPNLQATKPPHSPSLMKDWHIPYKFIMQVSINHGIVSGSPGGKTG